MQADDFLKDKNNDTLRYKIVLRHLYDCGSEVYLFRDGSILYSTAYMSTAYKSSVEWANDEIRINKMVEKHYMDHKH